jgi:hypothetical protein
MILNGTTQYGRVSGTLGLGNLNAAPRTFAAWVKRSRTSHSETERIMLHGDITASDGRWAGIDINTSNAPRAVGLLDVAVVATGSATIANTNTWHLVIGRIPAMSGEIRTKVRSFPVGGSATTTESALSVSLSGSYAPDGLYIGRNFTATNLFAGKVLYTTVWNSYLSDADCDTLETTLPTDVSAQTLVEHWELTSNGNGMNGNHLTLFGSPTFDTDAPELDPGGGGPGEDPYPYLIVPRRQFFVSRRVIQK